MPWPVYCDLVLKCAEKLLFGPNSVNDVDCAGNTICPIEIKLLGVLRVLGRDWKFDDIAKATGMGKSTVRENFHLFTENFVKHYFDVFVCRPSGDKLHLIMELFKKMGLPGCIGSTDCVHMKWDRCPVYLQILCTRKEGFPTLVFSVVVDHHRRILSCTPSFYGARNDKTIVRYDPFIMDVKNKRLFANVEFEMFDVTSGQLVKISGVYFICDGGYQKWSCMMNPINKTATLGDRLWSEWIKSTRKDAECTFGSLKGRFRFLRNGILIQDKDRKNSVFKTCCILHNMILEFDGLDRRWESNINWETLNPQPNNSDEGFEKKCQRRKCRFYDELIILKVLF